MRGAGNYTLKSKMKRTFKFFISLNINLGTLSKFLLLYKKIMISYIMAAHMFQKLGFFLSKMSTDQWHNF